MAILASSIAIFGGSFDPPHLGHETLVQELKERFQFKAVWVVPTGKPWLDKKAQTDPDQRLKMAELAFGSIPDVAVKPIEIERAKKTGQASYMIDTVLELKKIHPKLTICIGSDQWLNLPKWHRYQDLLKEVTWVVFERKGYPMPNPPLFGLKKDQDVFFYETQAPELSSTQIRQSCEKTGKPTEKTLSPRVKDYLMQQGLYGTKPTSCAGTLE